MNISHAETNIKLPFSFILYSIIAFTLSQILILWKSSFIIDGVFRTPILWSAAHLLVLGWALMVAMGSMYQLVPVAFLTPIWSERLGFWQFAITALGIATFSLALAVDPAYALVGGSLTLLGILLFLIQMFFTLRKQPKKNILTLFVGTSLVCLLLTIVMGMLLVFNLVVGIPGLPHLALLKAHILLGIVGWFSLLIFGFSYKMVPMFSLAHGFTMKWSPYVYGVYTSGLVATLCSFFVPLPYLFQLGMVLLFLGFASFTYHVSLILKKRVKKKLDLPFRFSLTAILIGAAVHLLAAILAFLPQTHHFYGILLFFYIMGWIVFSIMGYLFKIVPFLWWTHRYSQKVGKETVPALKDMIPEGFSRRILFCSILAFGGLILSPFLQAHWLFGSSQGLMALLSILFAFSMIRVMQK